MSKLNLTRRIVREASADLEYNDEKTGELKTEKVIVRFNSVSTSEIRERRQQAEDRRKADEPWFLADDLFGILTEIVESDGTKHEVTKDLLDGLATDHLVAINNAINEAVRPKAQAAK